MAHYYWGFTDPLASDANSGLTIATKKKTMAALSAFVFVGGDTVDFDAGDSWVHDAVATSSGKLHLTALANNVTFKAGVGWETLGKPVIGGAPYTKAITLINVGTTSTSIQCIGHGLKSGVDKDYVTIAGSTGPGTTQLDANGSGKYLNANWIATYVDANNFTIPFGLAITPPDPVGGAMTRGWGSEAGIYLDGTTNVTLRNITITRSYDGVRQSPTSTNIGLQCQGMHVTLCGNSAYNSGGTSTGLVVENCTASRIRNDSVTFKATNLQWTVKYCAFDYIGWEEDGTMCLAIGGAGDGVTTHDVNNYGDVHDCVFTNCLQGGCTYTNAGGTTPGQWNCNRVWNCTVTECRDSGITQNSGGYIEMWNTVVIAPLTAAFEPTSLVHCNFQVHNTSSGTAIGNTLVSGRGIMPASGSDLISVYCFSNRGNGVLKFSNNRILIYNSAMTPIADFNGATYGASSFYVASNNSFFFDQGQSTHDVFRMPTGTPGGNLMFSEFQALGFDAAAPIEVFGAPATYPTTASDLSPIDGSVILGGGVDLSATIAGSAFDLYGRPRGTHIDIGAQELGFAMATMSEIMSFTIRRGFIWYSPILTFKAVTGQPQSIANTAISASIQINEIATSTIEQVAAAVMIDTPNGDYQIMLTAAQTTALPLGGHHLFIAADGPLTDYEPVLIVEGPVLVEDGP